MSMRAAHTTMNLKFPKDFFKDYARGKPCQIRISLLCTGEPCASDETTVLCHLPGFKAIGSRKAGAVDLNGAWGCAICHDIVDGRRRVAAELASHDEIALYHHQGHARTIDALVKAGVLPNP